MLLIERLERAIGLSPDAPAFITGDEVLTYRSLGALTSATVRHLDGQGVRPGEVVALTLSQSPLHCIVFFALARLGAVSISVSPLGDAERAQLYRQFDVRAVVCDREDCGAEGVSVIVLRGVQVRGDAAGYESSRPPPVGEAPMHIALTSGTTGAQKGFMQTYAMFARRLDRRFYGATPRPRVIPPNLHITASIQLACHALCNGGVVVFPHGYDNANFLSAIQRHSVTHVTLPPAHLALMLPSLPESGPAFPSIAHLRLLGITPSPAFLDVVRRKVSPHIYIPYSMSEVGVVALATPETLAIAPRSSGRVVPGARLEVVGEDGEILAPGTPGEIRVAVEGMPSAYCGRDPDLSRFRDGWFYPGDRGYVTAEGFVYIEGRVDEILNVGGRKVAPTYAESILEEHPGVLEAAVFAFEEGIEGIRLAAAIVPKGALDLNDLAAYSRARLEAFAPARFFVVESIPRNARGKILRKDLPKMVSGTTLRP